MLGDRIKRYRNSKHMSQTALAVKLGVSPQSVSKWENHISSPDISILPAIARCFEISMDELFDFGEDVEHYKDRFVRFLYDNKMIRFGSFELKSGRISPYYIHSGYQINSSRILSLGLFFAECMYEHSLHSACLVGITPRETSLAVATSIAFYQKFGFDAKCCTDFEVLRKMDPSFPLCFITDTFTSGTTLSNELAYFKNEFGRLPSNVLVCIDRMEHPENGSITARGKIELSFGIKIHAIVNFDEIYACIERGVIPEKRYLDTMNEYKKRFIGAK